MASKHIPSTRKSTRAKLQAIPPTTEAPPELPKELQEKWEVCQVVATTANLLNKATFARPFWSDVDAAIKFQVKFHAELVEQLMLMPGADAIPAVKAEIEKRKKAKDGATKETAN